MYIRSSFLDKCERKYGKYAIHQLVQIVTGAMVLLWILDFALSPRLPLGLFERLCFNREAIFAGEIWRVFTFLFLPDWSNLLWLIIGCYFNFLIGGTLEADWGAFGLNLYFFLGSLFNIAAGFLTGFATNQYLMLSLFLAFAVMNPEFEINLFFFIPVKVKYIAFFDLAMILYDLIILPWQFKVMIGVSFLHFAIFMARPLAEEGKSLWRRFDWWRKTHRK